MRLPDLTPIAPSQSQTIAYDFGNFLPPLVRLVGAPRLNVLVNVGVDAVPSSRVAMGPVISTVPSTVGGTGAVNAAVFFQLSGCLSGVTYVLEVVCPRSDGSDTVEAWARLPCVGPS